MGACYNAAIELAEAYDTLVFVRFDPALGFHLYDLDFCRSAIEARLKIGTWQIANTHASDGGSVQSGAWAQVDKPIRLPKGEYHVYLIEDDDGLWVQLAETLLQGVRQALAVDISRHAQLIESGSVLESPVRVRGGSLPADVERIWQYGCFCSAWHTTGYGQ